MSDNKQLTEWQQSINDQMQLSKLLISSKAFPPSLTPEQAFVLIQAGKEMKMLPMEAISKLYIVNGAVGFHGKGLVSELTKHGVKFKYIDETDSGVTVQAIYNGDTYTEKVTDKDQILQRSKAMTFAKKNKMRFHGVRMIANFHLAHLCGSVSIWEEEDMVDFNQKKENTEFDEVLEALENVVTVEQLNNLLAAKKAVITKDIYLLGLLGKKKKELNL